MLSHVKKISNILNMEGDIAIFGRTRAEISRVFVDQMPVKLDKEEFFEETCSDMKCTCQIIDKEPHYSLEGPWESLLNAQSILSSWLNKWRSKGQLEKKHSSAPLDELMQTQNSCQISTPGDDLSAVLNDNRSCKDKNEKSPREAIVEHHSPHNVSEILTTSDEIMEHGQEVSCVDAVPLTSTGKEVNVETCVENISAEACSEREMCADIHMEHNYNYFGEEEKADLPKEKCPSPVENEIYMDIKLSKKPDDKMFEESDFPVALVVTSEDHPCIEVVQLNIGKSDTKKLLPAVGQDDNSKDRQELLKMRKKQYEEDTPYKFFCTQCSFKTKRHSHMIKHSRLHERVCKIYSCPDCDFSTIRMCHLQRHIRTHKKLNLSCDLCAYTTHKEELLIRHQRNKHINPSYSEEKTRDKFQCVKCSYTTFSEKFLERHKTIHTKEEIETKTKLPCFKCVDCSYKSPSRSNYYRHIANVHGDDRPYLCNICGLSFKRSDTLIQHRATHVDVNPQLSFQCSQCKKFYRSEKLLREHLLTHAENRTFLCEVCGAAFKTRAVQRKHYKEVHVLNKTHACSLCGKLFLTKSLVKRHMKIHVQIPNRSSSRPMDAAEDPIPPSSKQWGESFISVPPEDVQVLIVQPDQPQSELVLSQNTLLVQNSSLPQVLASSGEQSETLTVPVDFVIPDQVGTVNATDNQCPQTEEYICLTFG